MTSPGDEFEKNINNPHDAAFKSAFQKTEVARSFFQNYLPDKIRKITDLDQIELCGGNYRFSENEFHKAGGRR